MKAMRRILAVIAAMAMVLSLTPFAVFAADEGADDGSAVVSQVENEGGQEAEPEEADGAASDEAEPSDDAPEAEEEPSGEDVRGEVQAQDGETNVAQIDEAKYATLAAAVNAAAAGTTITLTADETLTSTIEVNNNLTIDLNGYNITATDARALWIQSGEVTITNSGTGGTGGTISTVVSSGTSLKNSSSVIRVGNNGSTKANLTISSGVTVSTDYCYGVTVFGTNTNGIELVLDGTVNVTGEQPAISGNGNSTLSATTMTINSTATVTSANNYAIYHPGKGTLTVSGTVSGTGGIEAKGGTINIQSGATITATAATQSHSMSNDGTSTSGYAIAAVGNSNYVSDPTVNITGGTIQGTAVVLSDTANTQPGTVVATDTSGIAVADDCMWVETTTAGTYQIAPAAAKVGDAKYATLAAAVEAATDGKTVKLLRNVALSQGVDISGTVTLDLNGKTISDASGLSDDYLLAVLHGGTLTVRDSGSGGMVSMIKQYCAIKMTKAGGDSTKNATLIVDSGIIEGKDFAISGNGNAGRGNSYITINGGTIRNTKSTGSGDDAAIYQPNTGTVTLNGGTITGLTGVEIRSGELVIPANSTVTVTGTGNPATYNGNSNGTTTFGAAIAIAQHTTDNPINVNIAGGSFSGAYALAVVNPNNRTVTNVTVAVSGGTFQGDLQVTDTRVTKFISGGTFSTAPDENFVADGCDALQGSGSWSVVPSLHNFDYTRPDVRWRVINADNDVSAKMVAIFIYHCTHCDETETVVVTPTYDDTSNSGKRTYTATDTEHGKTAELVTTTSYTVTLDGTNNGTYEWGQICSLPSPGGAKAWYVDSISPDNMVADGISSYVFAVTDTATTNAGTGTVTIVTGDPSSSDHQTPVIRPHLTATGSGTAVFNAKWSIPKGASVDSVTIYRGHTSSTTTTVSEDTLRKKGEKHTVYLKVWNGDYTLNLSGLTTGQNKYQHVMIEIVYTDSSGNSQTLTSKKEILIN